MKNEVEQLRSMLKLFEFVDQNKIPEKERNQLKYLVPIMEMITSSIKPDGDLDMDVLISLAEKHFILRSEATEHPGLTSQVNLIQALVAIRDVANSVLD